MNFHIPFDDLSQKWSLQYEELELLKGKSENSLLPFCMHLKLYKNQGIFPSSYTEIPQKALEYLMSQLDVKSIPEYKWKGRISRRHKAEILEYLGIKKTNVDDRERLKTWLIDTAIPKTINFEKLLSDVHDWLFKQRLMRPTKAVLVRLIRSAISQYEDKIFAKISNQLSSNDKA